MKTSSTAGSGSNVFGGVWLPKGTALLICISVVNKKKFIAPVSLLFRHTSYNTNMANCCVQQNELHSRHVRRTSVLRIFICGDTLKSLIAFSYHWK